MVPSTTQVLHALVQFPDVQSWPFRIVPPLQNQSHDVGVAEALQQQQFHQLVIHVCMFVFMHVCVHVYMCTYVQMCVCTNEMDDVTHYDDVTHVVKSVFFVFSMYEWKSIRSASMHWSISSIDWICFDNF